VAIYFGGWKQHYAVYPASQAALAVFADELAPYAVSKGTIRFPLNAPVPEDLIGRIAAFKGRELAERAAARAAARKARRAK
jgi:uncharacterized protein YdhG (YjbR/CyaY superfamily)